jgi:phosphatidylserine/phosphatidylglycerophosphate/cardiolipin synthase-like enzyme
VIVDGEVAFVGGIDLTSLGGDRFDISDHVMRGRLGLHEASSRVKGAAVADIAAHFAARWREVTGEHIEQTPPPAPAGEVDLQVVRTVPEKIYDLLPRGDFRIVEAYTRALRSVSQARLSREPVSVVSTGGGDPRGHASRAAQRGLPRRCFAAGEAEQRRGHDKGPAGGTGWRRQWTGRFLATTISARSGRLTGPLYVHAKVGIVDDAWLTVGSANLNEHSLFNDTEMKVVTCDPKLARATRLRLWSEHLERSVDEVSGEPAQVVDALWRPIAADQLERPSTRRTPDPSAAGAPRRLAPLDGPAPTDPRPTRRQLNLAAQRWPVTNNSVVVTSA